MQKRVHCCTVLLFGVDDCCPELRQRNRLGATLNQVEHARGRDGGSELAARDGGTEPCRELRQLTLTSGVGVDRTRSFDGLIKRYIGERNRGTPRSILRTGIFGWLVAGRYRKIRQKATLFAVPCPIGACGKTPSARGQREILKAVVPLALIFRCGCGCARGKSPSDLRYVLSQHALCRKEGHLRGDASTRSRRMAGCSFWGVSRTRWGWAMSCRRR